MVGSHYLGVGQRGRVGPPGHEPGYVGHVDHQQRVHPVGYGPKPWEIYGPGVSAAPRHDQLGLAFPRQPLDLVVVYGLGFPVHAVRNEIVKLARKVDLGPVGQVPPVVQPHPHHRVAGFQQGEVGGHVGLGPAMGLHVGVLRVEQLLGPLQRQAFHHVHVFAAGVVPSARIPLGVLVVHQAGLRLQHRPAGVVFRRNQHQVVALPPVLLQDGVGHLGVLLGQVRHGNLRSEGMTNEPGPL